MAYERHISDKELEKVGLSYIEEMENGIIRKKCGRGYSYHNSQGECIKNKDELARLKSLAIPPSYSDIWYCDNPNGHIQATGFDSQGKKQYFYHPKWEHLRDIHKFNLMKDFGERLPSIRRKITNKIKNADTQKEHIICVVIRILDKTGMRIGNESAATKNKTHGVTTLRKKHITIEDNKIHFKFKGKGGGAIECDIHDPIAIDIINKCMDIEGSRLFDYLDSNDQIHHIYASDINEYIKTHMHSSFSAKDFRTWRFSCLFLEEMMKCNDLAKLSLKGVLDNIVERTCNTPAILKTSYIHPGLLKICKEKTNDYFNNEPSTLRGLQKAESFLLQYVQSPHAQDTLKNNA